MEITRICQTEYNSGFIEMTDTVTCVTFYLE